MSPRRLNWAQFVDLHKKKIKFDSNSHYLFWHSKLHFDFHYFCSVCNKIDTNFHYFCLTRWSKPINFHENSRTALKHGQIIYNWKLHVRDMILCIFYYSQWRIFFYFSLSFNCVGCFVRYSNILLFIAMAFNLFNVITANSSSSNTNKDPLQWLLACFWHTFCCWLFDESCIWFWPIIYLFS